MSLNKNARMNKVITNCKMPVFGDNNQDSFFRFSKYSCILVVTSSGEGTFGSL